MKNFKVLYWEFFLIQKVTLQRLIDLNIFIRFLIPTKQYKS